MNKYLRALILAAVSVAPAHVSAEQLVQYAFDFNLTSTAFPGGIGSPIAIGTQGTGVVKLLTQPASAARSSFASGPYIYSYYNPPVYEMSIVLGGKPLTFLPYSSPFKTTVSVKDTMLPGFVSNDEVNFIGLFSNTPTQRYGVSVYLGTPLSTTIANSDLGATNMNALISALSGAGGFGQITFKEADALPWSKGLISNFRLVSTTNQITVYARGTPVRGVYPTMVVRVDGNVAATFDVTSTVYTGYTLAPNITAAANHKIDVAFTNDAYAAPEDRNLFIQSLSVGKTTFLPGGAGVTYDRGAGNAAYDGVNVIAGQGVMPWNGALRFTVPASAF